MQFKCSLLWIIFDQSIFFRCCWRLSNFIRTDFSLTQNKKVKNCNEFHIDWLLFCAHHVRNLLQFLQLWLLFSSYCAFDCSRLTTRRIVKRPFYFSQFFLDIQLCLWMRARHWTRTNAKGQNCSSRVRSNRSWSRQFLWRRLFFHFRFHLEGVELLINFDSIRIKCKMCGNKNPISLFFHSNSQFYSLAIRWKVSYFKLNYNQLSTEFQFK